MKKLTLAVCSLFVLSSLSFADQGLEYKYGKEGKEEKETRKAKMEAVKKDHMEYQNNLDALIEKYNAASDQDKAGVKEEIRVLVAVQTDKEIVLKKEMLKAQKERINKQEAKLADLEANKEARINEKVDFAISQKGQAKRMEMKEKAEKKKEDKNNNEKGKKSK